MPFSWFQSKRNQITLLRNLRDLCQLDYKTHLGLECEQRRERNGMRSISLFVMSGEAASSTIFNSTCDCENMISKSVLQKMSAVGL